MDVNEVRQVALHSALVFHRDNIYVSRVNKDTVLETAKSFFNFLIGVETNVETNVEKE